MAARVTHIGMDHHIRRHFGWPVEPGTTASLSLATDGWTLLEPVGKAYVKGRVLVFSSTLPTPMRSRDTPEWAPALKGITEVEDARRIIAEEL